MSAEADETVIYDNDDSMFSWSEDHWVSSKCLFQKALSSIFVCHCRNWERAICTSRPHYIGQKKHSLMLYGLQWTARDDFPIQEFQVQQAETPGVIQVSYSRDQDSWVTFELQGPSKFEIRGDKLSVGQPSDLCVRHSLTCGAESWVFWNCRKASSVFSSL